MPVATKKLRSNRAWIERHINDPFVKRSRAEGYRARSVYKLIELDEKEHLLKPGSTVVDLGSAPGSWTQVVRERLAGPDGSVRGRIIAMDILPMDPIDDVYFLQGDFREQEVADKLAEIKRRQGRRGPFGHGAESFGHRCGRCGTFAAAQRACAGVLPRTPCA